ARRVLWYWVTGLRRVFVVFFVNSIADLSAWVFVVAAAFAIAAAAGAMAVAVLWLRGSVGPAWVVAAIALTVAAASLALVGLIGDYTQRVYRQSSGRPFYLVRRVHEAADLVQQTRVR